MGTEANTPDEDRLRRFTSSRILAGCGHVEVSADRAAIPPAGGTTIIDVRSEGKAAQATAALTRALCARARPRLEKLRAPVRTGGPDMGRDCGFPAAATTCSRRGS